MRIHFKRCTPKTFGAVFCEIWNLLFVFLAIQLAGNFQDQKSSRPIFFNQQQNDIFEVQDSLEGAGKKMDQHSIRCFFDLLKKRNLELAMLVYWRVDKWMLTVLEISQLS